MISIDASALNRAVVMLANIPGAAEKAEKTAIKKTVKGIRRFAAQKVREEYTIQGKYVTRTLSASFNGASGELRSKGGVNDFRYFKTNPKNRTKRKPRNGIFVQVRRGGGGGRLPHAFIAGMDSGHVGVFERVGRSRLPIKKMTGPSTPSMLASPNVSEKVAEKMEERLNVNVDHEINAFLNGFRG